MKAKSVLVSISLMLAASSASAQPGTIGLAWDDCDGFYQKSFNCDSNAGGPFTLVGSFTPGTELPEFQGISADIIIQFPNSTDVPDWWQHGIGLCRGTTDLALDSDFTDGPFACVDFYVGSATGSVAYDLGYGVPNRARLRIQCAVPLENRGPIDPASEWYAFKIDLLRAKTVGSGSCAGCTTCADIVLDEIQLFQSPEQKHDPRLFAPSNRGILAHWQLLKCATPVKNATWGQNEEPIPLIVDCSPVNKER